MKLYIETSVISFWYDRLLRNRDKRRAVRRLLLSCARGVHTGHVSLMVRQELEASTEPYRSRDLALISRLKLGPVEFHTDTYVRLVEAYGRDPLVSRLPEGDHRHLAIFSASDLEALVTCNLKDLANQLMLDAVRRINRALGVPKELRTGPPEAFLPPEAG